MRKVARFLLVMSLVAIAMTSITCKPIPYYLAKVCKVYGRVVDDVTGLPLESVEVSVGDYQYSELTNGLGDYELELATRTWTLLFEKEGYEQQSIDITVDEVSNPRVKQDAFLKPVIPDLTGVWIGRHLLTNPETMPYVDAEYTFGADSSFQVLLYDDYDAVPRVLSVHPSSWGTYTLTSTTLDATVFRMYYDYVYIDYDPPISYSVPYNLSNDQMTLTLSLDTDWDGTPDTDWVLTRQ